MIIAPVWKSPLRAGCKLHPQPYVRVSTASQVSGGKGEGFGVLLSILAQCPDSRVPRGRTMAQRGPSSSLELVQFLFLDVRLPVIISKPCSAWWWVLQESHS